MVNGGYDGDDAGTVVAENVDCIRPEKPRKAATVEDTRRGRTTQAASYAGLASLNCPCSWALTGAGEGAVTEKNASRDRTIIGIVLGQVLHEALSNPEWVLLVVDDVLRRWHKHLDGLRAMAREDWDKYIGQLRVAVNMPEYTILHQFVDAYTHDVEGHEDLPDNIMGKVWFQHTLRLAPEGHPIHNNELDRDLGV
jgi:hypothetical protein